MNQAHYESLKREYADDKKWTDEKLRAEVETHERWSEPSLAGNETLLFRETRRLKNKMEDEERRHRETIAEMRQANEIAAENVRIAKGESRTAKTAACIAAIAALGAWLPMLLSLLPSKESKRPVPPSSIGAPSLDNPASSNSDAVYHAPTPPSSPPLASAPPP